MKTIDYTKYRLKSKEDLDIALSGISGIFIVHCMKCYKEFQVVDEPECRDFQTYLKEKGIKFAGCIDQDFLCNNYLTEKKLKELPSDIETVGVISCGLGIQFVAQSLKDKRVIALADSMPQSGNATSIVGYHGIALEKEKCAACGECYLNITGGICPIVECAKGLVNGPCGGAKKGKCEIDPDTDCAWEKIYLRLKEQGRKIAEKIEIRDYGKFKFEEKKGLSVLSQAIRSESFYGGVHPLERKEDTQSIAIANFPDPQEVVIFLSQHVGSPAEVLVKVGDEVKIGQKIAKSTGLVSSSVHSSVSGRVISLKKRIHPLLLKSLPAIIIENDGLDEIDPSAKPISDWQSMSKESLAELLQDKGIVGLGGAMFPTHVKFSPPKTIDILIINGCECEPYLNADNRVMIEYYEQVGKGVEIVKKLLGVENVIVGIEDNKPEALENMRKLSNVKVESLKTKYPQGAEKMLIKKVLNREVPKGGLPLDVGVVVSNVSTIFAIYQAIFEGLPLIQRVITISGDDVVRSGNYLAKIGTPLNDIVKFCFKGSKETIFNDYHVKMGGPMMGIDQVALDSSVIKGTTGFTFLKKSATEPSEERACIKCGRCVDVCPVELEPLYYAYYGQKKMWKETIKHNIADCIECGSCEYICSSKIALLSLIKQAKKNAKKWI
ncbi:MAG: electron transport complex subunit RsxC [Candidatus Ratteibacteria bacterium]|nr:electron transport complex subunit RsxC [Candidatus Ratteibacteria bacterium]